MTAALAAELAVGATIFIVFMWLMFFFDWGRGGKIVPKSNFSEQMEALKRMGDKAREWVRNAEDA